MRVKCLAQEHNTMSSARARTHTARSGDERTNHKTNAPPKFLKGHPIMVTCCLLLRFHASLISERLRATLVSLLCIHFFIPHHYPSVCGLLHDDVDLIKMKMLKATYAPAKTA